MCDLKLGHTITEWPIAYYAIAIMFLRFHHLSAALTLFLHHPPSTFAPLFRSQEEQIALEQKTDESRQRAEQQYKRRLVRKFRQNMRDSCRSFKLWMALRGKLYEDPICTEDEEEDEEERKAEEMRRRKSATSSSSFHVIFSSFSLFTPFFSTSFTSSSFISFSSSPADASTSFSSSPDGKLSCISSSSAQPPYKGGELKRMDMVNGVFLAFTMSMFMAVVSALAYDITCPSTFWLWTHPARWLDYRGVGLLIGIAWYIVLTQWN